MALKTRFSIVPKGELTRYQAGIYILIASVLWSTSGLFIKLIPWNPFVTAGIRSLFAALMVGFFLGFKSIKFNKRIFVGALILSYTLISFVVANKYTSAANAITLQYTAPIFTMLYNAVFLKKRPKGKDVLAILITLGGILLFFIDSLGAGGAVGNIIAITSGIGFAGVSIISSSQKEDNLNYIFWGQIITVIVGIPFIFFIAPPVLTIPAVAAVIYMGFFQLGLGYIVFGRAMRYATALDGTLISIIEPLINPLWVFLVLGEAPGKWAVLGAAVVVLCVTLWSVSNAKEASRAGKTENDLPSGDIKPEH